jgi:hypothetical protein
MGRGTHRIDNSRMTMPHLHTKMHQIVVGPNQ